MQAVTSRKVKRANPMYSSQIGSERYSTRYQKLNRHGHSLDSTLYNFGKGIGDEALLE